MKIGEFAQLNEVSAKMLRYYDEIGLFCPNEIDEQNGYRHYHPEQSHTLYWILTFKNLGFTLDEIRHLMSGPVDSANLVKALAYKRMEIAAAFKHVLTQSIQIDHLLTMIEQEGFQMNKRIDLTTLSVTNINDIKKNIPNTEMMLEKVEELMANALSDKTFAFIRMDMRQFKAFNDIDGYEVGDRVIVALYTCIEDTLMQFDNINHAISRAGGDEFVVFVEGYPDTLQAITHRFKSEVEKIDYQAIGCHKPIDIYIGAVIANTSGGYHLRSILDQSMDEMLLAHHDISEGGTGIKIAFKND